MNRKIVVMLAFFIIEYPKNAKRKVFMFTSLK
jgi:hypothetical protein